MGDGVSVAFSLSGMGGVPIDATLSPTTATTQSGLVSTTLNAGFINGTVLVTAMVNSVSGSTGPIAVEGGPPNLSKLAFSCDHVRVAGWEGAGYQLNCSAIVGDRNSNFPPNITAQFATEAGTIAVSVPATPDPVTGLGKATTMYQTGMPNPIDTTPNSLDQGFSSSCTLPSGAQGTCNPRDSWVSVIAYTAGEECYTDVNGNGKYDPGIDVFPPQCDQGEPFVDSNDDGQWEPGENFVDVDGDGQYTPANGVWDDASHHDIWRTTVVVWTDKPTTVVPLTTNWNNLDYVHCSSNTVSFGVVDEFGNFPGCDGTGDELTVNAIGSVTVAQPSIPCQAMSDQLTTTNSNLTLYSKVPVPSPTFQVSLTDGDGCSTPAVPGVFGVSLGDLTRTLDSSLQAEDDRLTGTIASGTYQ